MRKSYRAVVGIAAALCISGVCFVSLFWRERAGGGAPTNQPRDCVIESGAQVPASRASAEPDKVLAALPGDNSSDAVNALLVSPFRTVIVSSVLSPQVSKRKVRLGEKEAALVLAHNSIQNSIAEADLRGTCKWSGSQDGTRQLRISYCRENERAMVQCGSESCTVQRGVVCAVNNEHGIAMAADSLYLLMFRTYDAASFDSAEEGVLKRTTPGGAEVAIPILTVKSTAETLSFDAKTGRLLRAEVPYSGTVKTIVDFDDYSPLGGSESLVLPLSISVKVPAECFADMPVRLRRGRMLQLTLDRKDCHIRMPR